MKQSLIYSLIALLLVVISISLIVRHESGDEGDAQDNKKAEEALPSTQKKVISAESSACTAKVRQYADHFNNYYDPEEAYAFGLKILEVIRVKDLKMFISLIDGELTNGPRQKYIQNKTFSEIFSDNWRKEVLENPPECSPVGWRGFMLGNGLIWYNKGDNNWAVFSVNNWIQEKFDDVPTGWKSENKILSPQCFVILWDSRDNYEEFEDYFSINDHDDFEKNPGKYFGKSSHWWSKKLTFDPIVSSWGTVRLVTNVEECLRNRNELKIDGLRIKCTKCVPGEIEELRIQEDRGRVYQILSNISSELCHKLAPNIAGKCMESYLIEIGYDTGGSMGYVVRYNIYGMFKLKNKKKVIVPLKNFYTENDARNYVGQLEK